MRKKTTPLGVVLVVIGDFYDWINALKYQSAAKGISFQ